MDSINPTNPFMRSDMFLFARWSIMCIAIVAVLTGCGGGEMVEQKIQFPDIKSVSDAQWKKLSQAKVYFGHQSVGNNILEGIKDAMREYPGIKLNIVETSSPADFDGPIFAHSRVGKNVDPKSKTDSFVGFIQQGIGDKANVAFFKFCYVDMKEGTNVGDLFADYKSKMALVKEQYPNVKFIHVTVPLTTTKISWKTWMKEKMGKKDLWEYAGNIERNRFNDFIRKEYEGKEPVFDLAKVESTHPDGTRSSFTSEGRTYYSLVPEYTKDGGHLNEKGRKLVAEQLLILLATLSS